MADIEELQARVAKLEEDVDILKGKLNREIAINAENRRVTGERHISREEIDALKQ